jgi:hypothetical protein
MASVVRSRQRPGALRRRPRLHACSARQPVRQASLFRWCLSEGMRVVKPMALMTKMT